MHKQVLIILLSLLLGLLLFACSDGLDKDTANTGDVRVEYSDCTGCLKCVENFSCPEGAIFIDERTGAAAIEDDKCVHCMKCIDVFHCPDRAFTTLVDTEPPADILDLTAVSETAGSLVIRFTAPGDDGQEGVAWRYEASITGPNGQPLIADYEAPLPSIGGMTETWPLCQLPTDILATVRVQAFDEMNNHNARVEQSVMITGVVIDDTPPAVIDDLVATAGEADITLAWSAPGDDGDEGSAASYDLRYSTSTINEANWSDATPVEGAPAPAAAGAQQSLVLTDIPQQTELYFCIRATDESGNTSAPGPNASAATTGDITPPDAIDDVSVTSTSVSTIMIQWTAVGDNADEGRASAYVIKLHTEEITAANWGDIADWPNSLSPQPAGAAETFVFSGLEDDTTYYIAIKAVDDAGNSSAMGNVAQGVTVGEADTTPPAAITDLSVAESRADLTLSWTAPGDDGDTGTASSYDIRMSAEPITETNFADASALPSPPTPQQAGSTEYYFVTGAEAGTTWYFAVKAADDAANVSAISNVASISLTEDTTPPAAITDLAVDEGYDTGGGVTITWTAPGDDGNTGTSDHYIVCYSMQTITAENWQSANQVVSPPDPGAAGASQSCTVGFIQDGMMYNFAVVTVDENDNMSALSNVCAGKIVYTILSSCRDCSRCINRCPNNAITDIGSIKAIDPDRCDACGTCVGYCPYNLIRKWVQAY